MRSAPTTTWTTGSLTGARSDSSARAVALTYGATVASASAVWRARCAVENSRNAKSSNTICENAGSSRRTSARSIDSWSGAGGPLSQSLFCCCR